MPKHISWKEFLKVKEFIEGTVGFVILENAAFMILNVKGNGVEIPESFRLSIYQKRSGLITVYTNCKDELAQLYRGVNPWQMMKGSRKIRVQVDDAGWGCERIDAEILTWRGWVTYDQLRNDDFILTYGNDGKIFWKHFSYKFDFVYNGDLVHLHNRTINIAVTPNHHMKILRRKFRGNSVKKTEKIIGYDAHYIPLTGMRSNDRIPRAGEWKGTNQDTFILPELGAKKFVPKRKFIGIPMKDWCSFLGIWLAEGWTWHGKGNYRVGVAQLRKAPRQKIRNLLKKLPFKFQEKDNGFVIHDKQLWDYFHRLGNCYSKFIPRDILDLSPKYLVHLVNWMMLGDGNWSSAHGKKNSIAKYYTTSEKLRDGFQEVLVKLGYSFNTTQRRRDSTIKGRKVCATTPCYEITIRKGRVAFVGTLRKYLLPYKGRVFDLEVPNTQCFYVRRDGKGYFTGNSCLGGMLIGMWIEAHNRYEVREIPVSAFKRGTKFYLHDVAVTVQNLLSDLDPEKYYLELCTGWIFFKTREVLKKTRWQVLPQKIEGFLQDRLEADFRNLLVSRYGLPPGTDPENYLDAYKFALKCYNEGKFEGEFKWDPHSSKRKENHSEGAL